MLHRKSKDRRLFLRLRPMEQTSVKCNIKNQENLYPFLLAISKDGLELGFKDVPQYDMGDTLSLILMMEFVNGNIKESFSLDLLASVSSIHSDDVLGFKILDSSIPLDLFFQDEPKAKFKPIFSRRR
ncbi:MAG: hypothetical protein GY817_04845 [bacterium]|nr:hypothetical protein [bacterium]